MLEKIKRLADEAVALQNKLRMEAALREISALCAAVKKDSGDGYVHDTFQPAVTAVLNTTAAEVLGMVKKGAKK